MKKIVLSLDALRVESFPTTASASALRGTVRAAGASEDTGCESQGPTHCGSCGPTDCLGPSCGTCEPTFAYSCYGSCVGETCEDRCPPPLSLDC